MEILRVLWEKGEATARDVTDALNALRPDDPPAHSTVQTQLRELEAKGVVGHRRQDRTFVFFPTAAEGEVTVAATRDLLTRLFEGSPLRLMTHLLRNERWSPEELDRLRRLIDEAQGAKGGAADAIEPRKDAP
jgi:Predicted transcriptional regulator